MGTTGRRQLFFACVLLSMAASSLLARQSSIARQAQKATLPAAAALAGWQADFNGDGKPDFCQIVTRTGFSGLTCRIAGTNQPIASGNLDLGYPEGRAFVDFDGDGKQDYCRVTGNGPSNGFVSCTPSDGTKFGDTLQSPPLDWGYPETRQWRDVNGDGKADFCRVVGNYRELTACTFSQGRVKPYFGRTVNSKR
jgi:hypothetical protein